MFAKHSDDNAALQQIQDESAPKFTKNDEEPEEEIKAAPPPDMYANTAPAKPIDDPTAHYNVARRLTRNKEYKEALIELNKTLTLNPQYWDARYLGAYIYQLEGRNDEAIARYQDFVAHKPDVLSAHINLGILLRKKGDYSQAEEELRNAIEINFYAVQAHYNLANVLIDDDNLQDALKELKICVKMQPSNAWAHNNLGVIYHKRHYFEEAEQEFLRALTLEPANKIFESNLALVRKQLKKKTVQA